MNKPHIYLTPCTDTRYRWTCSNEFPVGIIAGYGEGPTDAYEDFLANVINYERSKCLFFHYE